MEQPGDRQQQPRAVRVFISSTFRDMQAERDELVKRVFPQLRKLCEQHPDTGVLLLDRLATVIAQRLRNTHEQVVALLEVGLRSSVHSGGNVRSNSSVHSDIHSTGG